MSVGEDTSGKTVADIIERLYLQWLRPPDAQPIYAALGAPIDDTTSTITIGSFTIPEDEALLRQGAVLEIDQEVVRVVTYTSLGASLEVLRGQYGTKQVAHGVPSLMVMNPSYPRATVFEAVADNIITLFPKLFTTKQAYLTSIGGSVFPFSDDLAVSILSAWGEGWTGTRDVHGEIVDFHQLAGGRAAILNGGDGAMWFRYRRRMAKPTSEVDLLDDLGVDERWVTVVMAGAAADLMAGKDITASHTEWVKSVLEAETISVGTRMSIGGGLRQYRNMLIDDFAKEMRAEYKPKVRMRRVNAAS